MTMQRVLQAAYVSLFVALCSSMPLLAYALDEEEVGPTPSPSPSPSPTPSPAPVWTLELFNVDDRMKAECNGVVVANVSYQNTKTLTLNPCFERGQRNTLRITAINTFGGWSYGFRIKKDGVIATSVQGHTTAGSCGKVNEYSCNNDGHTGIVFEKGYYWTP